MEYEKSSARKVRSLPDLAASIFSLILSLRTSRGYGREDELRSRIGTYLEQIDKEGRDAGIARENLEAAKYPLVAFIDETILNSQWEYREAWRARPLQLDLYGETILGEKFFEQLEKIRAAGDSKHDLLEIYYLCISLGFQGKYSLLGVEKLRSLQEDVRRELGYGRSQSRAPVSPRGRRKEPRRSNEEDGWPLLKIAAGCAGGLLLLFVILFFLIGHSEGGAVQKLQGLAG